MKWLTLLFACATTAAFAQNDQAGLMQKLKRQQELRTGQKSDVLSITPEALMRKRVSRYFQHNPAAQQNLPRAILVTPLPQDGMPCVVPDMRQHKIMPDKGDSTILKQPIDPGIYAYKNR